MQTLKYGTPPYFLFDYICIDNICIAYISLTIKPYFLLFSVGMWKACKIQNGTWIMALDRDDLLMTAT
jgi:hypothetical protein